MIKNRRSQLLPILESRKGLHLTVYLSHRKSTEDLAEALLESRNEAYDFLLGTLKPRQAEQFLQPIDSLIDDTRVFRKIKTSLAIFRSETTFRILSIPLAIEDCCVVATSFHVKPLLRWLQNDQDFALIGIEPSEIRLMTGSLHDIRASQSLHLDEGLLEAKSFHEKQLPEVLYWISESIKDKNTAVYLAGIPMAVQALNTKLKSSYNVRTLGEQTQRNSWDSEIIKIRQELKNEVHFKILRSLSEYKIAQSQNKAKQNLFQIAKAVVQRKVKKLIIADQVKIFGKFDPDRGHLDLHPFPMDHEDDDVLDDLAQAVLRDGGEVVVTDLETVPQGRAALAILKNENEQSKLVYEENPRNMERHQQ